MAYNPLAARESIKTGLAMALACGFSMAQGWQNPYWACIAVAVVSLPTVGESLNKSFLRLWGTAIGGAVGLLALGLFAQDRWAFLLLFSLYLAFCAYRITLSRYIYFWFISGYVALLIAAYGYGGTSQQAFSTATIRLQETALGIIVYALVSVFLWPQRCSDDLKLAAKNLASIQAKTLQQYFALMLRRGDVDRAASWYSLENQLIGQLKRRLDAAETEQFEVHEVRHWWRRLIGQFQKLMESLEIWRETFPELQHIDLERLLPNLPQVQQTMQDHLSRLIALAEGKPAGIETPAVSLAIDGERLEKFPHLQRSAVLTMRTALSQIEARCRALVASMQAIKEVRHNDPPQAASTPTVTHRPDGDSLVAAIRGFVSIWMSAFIWIYVDPPGGMMLVVFTGIHTLMGVMGPQMNWVKFFLANVAGIVIAGLLYVFVLPSMSSYTEFGLLLFGITTAIYYTFWHPRQTVLKFSAIVPFIMLTNLQNHQTYDFVNFAINASAMLMSIPLAAVSSRFPISLRAEKMFLRLRARYFRQALKLMAAFDAARSPWQQQERIAQSLASMQTSVSKIGGWATGIDYKNIPQNKPEKAAALTASINTITYRFMMLADAQKEHACLPSFHAALHAWIGAITALLTHWSGAAIDRDTEQTLHAAMAQKQHHLEQLLERTFQTVPEGLTQADYTAAYRLLGGYRGVYEALVAHAALTANVQWDVWRESRF